MVEQRSPKPLARVRFLVPPPSLFTKFNEQKAKEEREKIKELMKKNEEIKKKLKNLST